MIVVETSRDLPQKCFTRKLQAADKRDGKPLIF